MKHLYFVAIIGCAAVFIAGYAFFLLQRGMKEMPPSLMEHAAIAPIGSNISVARQIQ